MDSYRNVDYHNSLSTEQWGSYTNSGNAYTKTTTFPLAFSTVYAVIQAQGKNADGNAYYNSFAHTVTTTSFKHQVYKEFYTGWCAFGK